MNDQDGNTYDEGTITFDGNPEKGIYEEINFYEVDYHGEYELRGENVELTGDEHWNGIVSDANHMSGTWSHEDGAKGTWTAIKLP